ncbi:UGSC family (seleno)protein [Actinophytocola sp.]|uniref:UGSC family (seleno)protein n=1 Tax=Actinophytocola sp. TaxID=1872138 RepID=UPI003D6B8B9E
MQPTTRYPQSPLMVLSPAPSRPEDNRTSAPRPADLGGLTVGLLDNNKPGASVILKHLGELLRGRGAAEVRYWCKPHPSGPSQYVSEAAKEADIVISGVGDCGSCSSWSLRDALDVEAQGRPTVTLVSQPFLQKTRIEADALGLAGAPIFAVEHPMATRPDDNLRSEAEGLLEAITTSLVRAG